MLTRILEARFRRNPSTVAPFRTVPFLTVPPRAVPCRFVPVSLRPIRFPADGLMDLLLALDHSSITMYHVWGVNPFSASHVRLGGYPSQKKDLLSKEVDRRCLLVAPPRHTFYGLPWPFLGPRKEQGGRLPIPSTFWLRILTARYIDREREREQGRNREID